MTIDELLNNYRDTSTNETEKGTKFERLMKYFLSLYYSGEIKKVMRWNEFSNEHDLGIDLVAETYSGELWAIQCKCYAENTVIEKADVDSFISNSGRTFHGKKFSLRLFISTSSNFTDNALKMFENQTPSVIQIGMEDLRAAAVDWEKLDAGELVKIPRNLRKYQINALNAAQEHFKNNSRGKLIMACGTGKTFTALRIAENLTDNGGLTLFLVPSLSLVKQSLQEWINFSVKPIRAVCVCGDKTVASDDDTENVLLQIPVTNEPEIISAAVNRRGNFGMTVIFSTYQSIDKVIAANLNFDLVICDEAHRTAGNSQKDDKTRLFSLVHDNEKINAKRRLYMTATPKLYSESSKTKANENNIFVWSMDDENIFGKEFFRISFKEAIKLGCLSEYKLLIFAVSENEIKAAMRDEVFAKVKEIVKDEKAKVSFTVDELAKLVGTINAMSKRVTEDSKALLEGDLKPMNKAVAFLPKIIDSKVTAKIFQEVENIYRATLEENERAKLIDINAEHVDGSFNSGEREKILNNLKNTPENLCNIITNVRCLSEGVDVPSLDAVIFLTPKKSKIDIVQAVGRALRIAQNKKFGYVIVPIIVPSKVNAETKNYFEANNEKYNTVFEVARMLGAHDETMNVEIERLSATGKSKKIKIIRTPEFDAEQTVLPFDMFQTELIAHVVDHAGNKNYWIDWAQKVSVIVQRHTEEIKKLIAKKDSPQAAAFKKFIDDLHKIINPAITEDEAVDMLAQHLITRPVFEALFDNFSFVQNNPVSKSMTQILYQLDKSGFEDERAELKDFYDKVRESCSDMGDAKNRQKIIVSLYDSFFKMALPQTVERLGIVYTPVEVVDFILNSVNDVLKKEFGRTVSSPNVHVLDPFSGTGTFITRLIESGLINPADLVRKYRYELHANEIVLLAYYISAINIENSFHHSYKLESYLPFDGICLTDTFQTYENANNKQAYLTGYENPLRENSALIKQQLDTKIEIIVGNPPYSVGQKSANDNAQNVHYTKLEKRIADTYISGTTAGLKQALYDSYVKAFRWAADRIKGGGVVGFITNSGWIDKDAFTGFRKSLQKEFSSIYVFNLKGAIRGKIGDTAKREGQNIFNIMTGVAITILVKNPDAQNTAADIFYLEVEDYLSREDKLAKISAVKSVLSGEFKILKPNDKGDWINQRGNTFEKFIPIQPQNKFDAAAKSFFVTFSTGIKTNRDAWIYNFSKIKLAKNIQTTIDFYNSERQKLATDINHSISFDSTKFSWDNQQKFDVTKNKIYCFSEKNIAESSYRPFCKSFIYFSKELTNSVYQMPKLFPNGIEENYLICLTGAGGRKDFSVFITDKLTDLELIEKAQCFPMYWYEETKEINMFEPKSYTRREGVTDYILEESRRLYGGGVSKADIFYYVYGFLHLPAYREEFAADLKKSLPRLILVEESEKFWAISKAGRQLAEIHLHYENQPPANVEVVKTAENYAVEKLRLSKDKSELYYNKDIVIKNIPARAFEYVVNGRSPLEWIIDRYQIKTDKASGITNNPNDWCAEHNQPRYILDLILSSITVSLKTLDIVENLPRVEFE